jgi:1-deoxy-D-xylulose-5-phosphate reductoisomerase
VFNGADEACVAAFLGGRLPFTGIVSTVARVVDEHLHGGPDRSAGSAFVDGNNAGLSSVTTADAWARRRAEALVEEQTGG